ncbi:hypothetical protein HPB49_003137 [Dermacentor silvarum]|uniref:Uncharacterized protein n=1 Tax=Dermacentor silvarum TaxID=543639 RepID=A0ACB8C704_DERSI|nr:hypothetical protein HPB49_003137 [Dermacentor silvarum]
MNRIQNKNKGLDGSDGGRCGRRDARTDTLGTGQQGTKPKYIKGKVINAGRMPRLPKDEIKIVVRPQGGLDIVKSTRRRSRSRSPSRSRPRSDEIQVQDTSSRRQGDLKIVVRPHQGLPVKNLTSSLLADAVIAACGGQISGEQFLLRIKPGYNIFVVSTPHQTVADYAGRIAMLSINGRPHSVNAYVATSDGTTKGVIHGLDAHTTPEALKANLRIRTQGVEILQARMFRIITFFGRIMPRYVYYNSPGYPYKVTTCATKWVTDPQPSVSCMWTTGPCRRTRVRSQVARVT